MGKKSKHRPGGPSGDDQERRENILEAAQLKELREIEEDLDEVVDLLKPKLKHVKIAFKKRGGFTMLGPVTLTVGASTVATVQGFDQNGAPFPIDFTNPANAVTWAIDDPALDSKVDQPDQSTVVTSLAGGTANMQATCAGFTDVEQIINVAVTPALSSVKIDFATPTVATPK